MKKLILRGLAAITLLLSGLCGVQAQGAPELPQLPQDPNVIIGKLDNGLTYYIRHNETPRGQADFFIAQKVGSILEEDNQRGLAHFLEHMCFNGTENFPDKGIINWLESVGVAFGRNLNAYTSVDETVYNISNVPVARQSVQDSCLLILHDWSTALTLDPAEIDAERGVIHEEWRQSMVGTMRVIEEALPSLYPDSRYGYRLPIGTMEVVDNFPPQALIDYYHKWYRPDQQAVIVVGDIDPEYIQNKIIEIFSPIQMPENAAEREYYEVPDTPGTLFAVGSDPEIQFPIALMFFKTDNAFLPTEMRNTDAFFLLDYMKNVAEIMMENRLDDLSKLPDTEFASASVSIGEYFLSRTKGSLDLEVVAKGNDIIPALNQAYTALARADQHGFTVGEYERARSEFLSRIDRQYQDRNNRQSGSYSREYVKNFTENIPAPGIEVEKEKYNQYANLIDVNTVNQWFQGLMQDDNRALLIMMPQKDGYTNPTEEAVLEMIEEIDNSDLEAYQDEMRTDPLIPNLPAPGSVSSSRELETWGATEYTLSNGVKVVLKTTDFKNNQILFEAQALGKGESTFDQSLAPSILFAPIALSSYALNDYSNSDIQKYLSGKQVEIDYSIDDYTRSITGNSTVADLPTLMELIYATFTGLNLTEQEFNANQSTYSGLLANQESNPQFIFLREARQQLSSLPTKQSITAADVLAADRQTILDIYRPLLANAADYTFYFVGSVDAETLIPLMEQYIATLPADPATATTGYTRLDAFELPTGTYEHVQETEMQTPQTWAFIVVDGHMPYTAKNRAVANITGRILSKRLLNKVREEMGATYSIGAQGNMNRTDSVNYICQIAFPMKPEMKGEVLSAIHDIIFSMPTTVTAEELAPAIEYLNKTAVEGMEKNEDWLAHMTATELNGINTFFNAQEVLQSITIDDIQQFMAEILGQGNYRTIILDPANFTPETPAAE